MCSFKTLYLHTYTHDRFIYFFSQLHRNFLIVEWLIGGLCVDVPSSARWFSSGHTCEYYVSLSAFALWNSHNTRMYMQVFEIAKTMGWVPALADRNKTYLHLNKKIPNELKFDLNCLLYTHGKLCHRCTKRVGKQQRKESHDSSCPLLNYCKNSYSETS